VRPGTLLRWGSTVLLVGLLVAGCAGAGGAGSTTAPAITVGALTGPTGMGLAPLMAGQPPSAGPAITVTLYATPDEITPQLVNGTLPLATIPVNLAAVLHAKTSGQIQLAAVNTRGVLYVVAKGAAATTIHGIGDLAGRTVWSTGAGTTPQYVMDDLLRGAGVTADVQYLSAATEVAARLAAAPDGIAVLPEPYVTTLMAKDPAIVPVIDLTTAWAQAHPDSGLVTGALVVNRAWADAHPDLFTDFLTRYQASIAFAVDHPDQAGPMVAAAGIVPDATTATAALPRCHLVYLTGAEARAAVQGYLSVLFAANPAAVGGTMPGDDFYRTLPG